MVRKRLSWRKLLIVEIFYFYSAIFIIIVIIIIRVIKSRQVRWVGFVACMEHERNAQCFGGGT